MYQIERKCYANLRFIMEPHNLLIFCNWGFFGGGGIVANFPEKFSFSAMCSIQL